MVAVLENVRNREEVSYEDDDSDLAGVEAEQDEELHEAHGAPRRRDFESGDDVLTLYFAEVGRTPLLDADGEKLLGRQIEDGKHIKQLEEEVSSVIGCGPGPVELVLALAERLSREWLVLEWACQSLGVSPEGSLQEKVMDPDLRRAIDGHIDEQLSSAITGLSGLDQTDVEKSLVNLSLDSRLLPWNVMDELGRAGTLTEFIEALQSEEFREGLAGHSLEVAEHFEAIGERARRATAGMIQANLRLVVSVAKRHANRGVPLHDIIQEGNIGLMQAVRKFDHRRGYKFSTYAIPWIWQAINRGVNEQSRVIHLPGYLIDDLTKLTRERNSLAQKLGRQPTENELAAEVELPPEKVEALVNLSSGGPVSLETPLGEDGNLLGDLIADEDIVQPDEQAATSLLSEELHRTLESLTPRERRVIKLRFGLGDEYSHTLAEVGTELGLTKERIRQIEKAALAKLRHPSHSRELIGYLG